LHGQSIEAATNYKDGNFMIKCIAKLVFGIILGIIPSLWITQNNNYIKQVTIPKVIRYLGESWNAHVSIDKTDIDLFSGIVYFENLIITSRNKVACCWKCKNGSIELLKQSSFTGNQINLHVNLNKNEIVTAYTNGELGMTALLQSIFTSDPELVNTQSFRITDNKIKIATPDQPSKQETSFELAGSIFVKRDKQNLWHTRITTPQGSLTIAGNSILKNISGNAQFDESPKPDSGLATKIDYSFIGSPLLASNAQGYRLAGSWDKKTKSIYLLSSKSVNHGLSFSLTSTTNKIMKNALLASLNLPSLPKTLEIDDFTLYDIKIESLIDQSSHNGQRVSCQ